MATMVAERRDVMKLEGQRAARAIWSYLVEPGDPPPPLDDAERALEDLRTRPDTTTQAARWRTRLDGLSQDILSGNFPTDAGFVMPGDEHWPVALDDLGEIRPIGLWVKGSPEVLTRPAISVVGARAATSYGVEVAGSLGRDLSTSHVLVSGGAYGIDAAVHRAVLAGLGRTIVVLAGGVDRAYPAAHRELFEAVTISGGAVISEQPPGATPARHRFLSRNRIIAALGQVTVVVEAGIRSGALATARRAAELGRDVGAVPGPVTSALSAGTNQLLRDYGICVTGADDVRELLGAIGPDALPIVPESNYDRLREREKRVWNALAPAVVATLPAVAREAGLSASETVSSLEFLKSIGLARSIAGRWIRVMA